MNKMNQLPEQIQQININKTASEVSLVDVDFSLLPGRCALKNAALARYNEQMNELVASVGDYAGGMFVRGPGAVAFTEIAEDEGPAITIDVTELYRLITTGWYSTVRQDGVFALDSLLSFQGAVGQILSQLGVRSIPIPEFGPYLGRVLSSFEDGVALTREIIRGTVMDDLLGLYIDFAVAHKIVREQWELNIVPVSLVNASQAEIEGELFQRLFSGHNIVVDTKPCPENNDVIVAFRQLRAKMQPTSATTSAANETANAPKRGRPSKTSNNQNQG